MNVESPALSFQCRGIAAVLLHQTGEDCRVLLLQRASAVLHDEWCYIGGGIEPGETAWQAALREIREETGLTPAALYSSNQFDRIYSPQGDFIYVAPVFVAFVEGEPEVKLNAEHKAFEWLSFEEAIDKAALPGNDVVLQVIEKHFVRKKPSEWLRILF